MARHKDGVNKSEEIRVLLKANPKITAKEVRDALGAKGIRISPKLYYLVKGKLLGRQARKKKARKMVGQVMASTGASSGDALSTILKVKRLAGEVGGMRALRQLVEAITD